MEGNKKENVHHFRNALSEIDWYSPNTHVFFGVQIIGIVWLVFLLTNQLMFGVIPIQKIATIAIMILARYYVGMWFVTVWRHRYFSHYSFQINRHLRLMVETITAFICSMDAQRGVIKWSLDHIKHHKFSDRDGDEHSCVKKGIAWCHMLWVTKKIEKNINLDEVPIRLKNNKVIVWIEDKQWIGIIVGGGIFSLVGTSLSIGNYDSLISNFIFSLFAYFFSTTLLWNGTFLINSAMHLFGTQRYITGDNSRNNWICAVLTLGEGWHNNHHGHYPALGQPLYGKKRPPVAERYWQGETFFERSLDWSGISIWLLMKLGFLKPLGAK